MDSSLKLLYITERNQEEFLMTHAEPMKPACDLLHTQDTEPRDGLFLGHFKDFFPIMVKESNFKSYNIATSERPPVQAYKLAYYYYYYYY